MATPLPSLFISHGSPDLPLSDHPTHDFLRNIGANLPRPDGIIIASAHWYTPNLTLTNPERHDTIHDFYGFPPALYQLTYPAPGSQQLAQRAVEALAAADQTARTDADRGLDHGAWVPLRASFPDADIPVVQISLLQTADPKAHHAVGHALAPLRNENILIIGSGSSTHNLGQIAPEGSAPATWALEFESWLNDCVTGRDMQALFNFGQTAPHVHIAHPSVEHFLPLFFALGAGEPVQQARRLHHSYSYGNLAMTTFAFGEDEISFDFAAAG